MTRGPKLRAIGAGSFLVAAVLGAGAQPSGAAFAGHNGRIAFVSGSVILSATTSGKELRFLTSPGVVSTEPEFSPNGKLIVYARSDCDSPDGPCGLADLWRMAANGSHKQQLTDTAHTAEGAPAWSPSGKQIVFAESTGGDDGETRSGDGGRSLGLRVMTANGSHQRQLTAGGTSPTWSPNGRKIAYTLNDTIYVIPAGGRRPRNLTPRAQSAVDPDWSPDGRRILFSLNNDLAVMNADGSHERRITTNGGSVNEDEPAWSPDGRWIIYRRYGRDGVLDVIRPTGKDRHRVPDSGDDSLPTWQPQ